jgi:hypothetical protein
MDLYMFICENEFSFVFVSGRLSKLFSVRSRRRPRRHSLSATTDSEIKNIDTLGPTMSQIEVTLKTYTLRPTS